MPVTVKSNLPKISRDMVDFLDAAIRREGFSIERDMKSSMKGQGTGVIYVRQGRTHQASAPGQPPARDYGYLANSIHTLAEAQPHTVYVLIDDEVAVYLEHGTVHMAPRPFVAPAVEKSRKRLKGLRLSVTGPPA